MSTALEGPIRRCGARGCQGAELALLGGWRLTCSGRRLQVPYNTQRVLAMLALLGPRPRSLVAGTLWPEQSDSRANGSLRSTLWRLDRATRELLDVDDRSIALRCCVSVDVAEFVSVARSVVNHEQEPNSRQLAVLVDSGDLLPGWYDEWVLVERDRLRQLRLHALEVLADLFSAAGRLAGGLEAALAAVRLEPNRESAHRVVLRIHLAEGNTVAAVKHFQRYRAHVRSELGMEPSEQMGSLIRPFLGGRMPAPRVPPKR